MTAPDLPSPDSPADVKRIGVFDSGVGGLSVLREIHRLLPDIPTLYYADQAHVPYGVRSPDNIRQLVDRITTFLIARGARLIVIACHTASAVSLRDLRARYPQVPFVGMEPAVKPAVERTRTGVVGVLTTQITADGALYRSVLERFGGDARVITQVAQGLVTLVEDDTADTPEGQAILRGCVQPLVDANADHIVLACTHFPFLARQIAALTDATLVDPAPAVARQVARVLPPDVQPSSAPHLYYTSGDPAAFQTAIRQFLGYAVDVQSST